MVRQTRRPPAPVRRTYLCRVTARGPLSSDDIDDEQRDHHGWGAGATLAKTTLQKLFFTAVSSSPNASTNAATTIYPSAFSPRPPSPSPSPTASESDRWFATLKLRQRRLVALKRTELPAVEDLVQPIAITDCGPLYRLRSDLALLDEIAGAPATKDPTPPLLVAPLDPLIYDRRLTARLWNLDYTWEVYTPAAKRTRGYYALPILSGHEFVGHIDPKADRDARKLRVVSRRVRRGHVVAPAVRELARFLGLK